MSEYEVMELVDAEGVDAVLRGHPTVAEAQRFVDGHHARHARGAAGGPSGQPALRFVAARWWRTDWDRVERTKGASRKVAGLDLGTAVMDGTTDAETG